MTGLRGDLWTLFDLASAPESGSVEEVVAPFLREASALFQATGASIYLRGESEGLFRLAAKYGVDAGTAVADHIRSGEGIAGSCIEGRTPLLVGDPMEHPLLKGRVQTKRDSIRSALVLPLVIGQDFCLGVLNLSRSGAETPFAEQDLAAAWSVARHLALAVRNVSLLAERNAALNEARVMRDEIHTILTSLAVGVVCFNADGAFESANPEALSMLGGLECNKTSELGRDLIDVAMRVPAEGRMHVTSRQGNPLRVVSLYGAPIEGGGVVVAMEDVTESDRNARELTRMRRLAEIGQMTAAIAHEIRNPLSGICGAAQMLIELKGPEAEFAQMIHDEGLRLNALCSDFLDFARPMELNLEAVDLRSLAKSVVTIQSPKAQEAGVTLVYSQPDEPVWGVIDRSRMAQVMHNLVLNAIQACSKDGVVNIILEAQKLTISDNGKGMSEETVGHLFTPFFTTRPKGTGLGLSTVRKIIDAHGGAIDVESELGKGTTFVIQWDIQGAA